MSCIDGFSLQGWKCVSNKNVSFSITLNANPTQISTDIDNIINSIIKLLNLTDPNSVTIMEINTGSTILVGSVSSTSPS